MPADQRVRLDDPQDRAPVDQPCEQHEDGSRFTVGPSRPDSALLVERQLLREKQVLRGQPRSRRQREADQGDDVGPQAADRGRTPMATARHRSSMRPCRLSQPALANDRPRTRRRGCNIAEHKVWNTLATTRIMARPPDATERARPPRPFNTPRRSVAALPRRSS
jgi:hypothetical protein